MKYFENVQGGRGRHSSSFAKNETYHSEMKTSGFFKVTLCIVCGVLILMLHQVFADDYTVGEIDTEKLFRKYFPGTLSNILLQRTTSLFR